MKKQNIINLVLAALFAVLIFVGTASFSIALPFGYFNLGDGFLLLAAWILGGYYAMAGAALGAALADLILGFVIYAPATLIIKAVMVVIAFQIPKFISKDKPLFRFAGYFTGSVLAELFMVVGYYLFESALYGFGAALASVPGNLLQGAAAVVMGNVVISILDSTGLLKKIAPERHTDKR